MVLKLRFYNRLLLPEEHCYWFEYSTSMQIKGMQTEQGSNVTSDRLSAPFNEKSASANQENGSDTISVEEHALKNGNGIHDVEAEGSDKQSSSGSRSHNSPSVDQEASILPSNDITQPLNFELGSDVHGNTSGNNFWQMPPQEDGNMFQNFQPINAPPAPQSMANYGLNNNNSFPQPIHFGSIGQPPSYLPGSHGQFSSPPGMHGMSVMGGMGPMNGPMGGMSYQSSHSQNQRRAITAQHNYGSISGKPMNARFPWSNQQNSWPNGNQQPNVSPWTMALQQQKAMNRPGNVNMGPGSKKGQSNIHINHTGSMNNPMMQQHKYTKRSSPVPTSMMSGGTVKGGYPGTSGADSINSVDTGGYQNNSIGIPPAGDSMKLDALQTQLMDIIRHPGQYEHEKGFGEGLEFSGEDLASNTDHRPGGAGMNGNFPMPAAYRPDRPERFSRKVFVGGLPPDIDEEEISGSFRRFGPVVVDWPHKAESKSYFPPKGYCFLLFQEELSVQALIDSCLHDDSKMYWCVTSPTMKDKPVQIRPWNLSDSDFVMDGSQTLDPRRTIFVGGVPRPLRALELAMIIDRLYGGVCYAGIDTDPELKYPKGAGRVAFSNQQSYIAAISARFVQLQLGDIDKRVEVKPYVLDDQLCDECGGERCNQKFAPFFCANVTCLQYYCEQCWATIHSRAGREYHKPLIKEGADRPRAVPFRWC